MCETVFAHVKLVLPSDRRSVCEQSVINSWMSNQSIQDRSDGKRPIWICSTRYIVIIRILYITEVIQAVSEQYLYRKNNLILPNQMPTWLQSKEILTAESMESAQDVTNHALCFRSIISGPTLTTRDFSKRPGGPLRTFMGLRVHHQTNVHGTT